MGEPSGPERIDSAAIVRDLEGLQRGPRGAIEAPCQKCGGLRWVVQDDGGAGSATPCPSCWSPEERLQQKLGCTGMTKAEVRSAIEEWDRSRAWPKAVFRWAKDWAEGDPPIGLIMASDGSGCHGAGKTKAALVATKLFALGHPGARVRWRTALRLPMELKRFWEDKSREIENDLCNCDWLAYDEMGREGDEKAASAILRVIQFRADSDRPTLLVTNASDVAQIMDGALSDRQRGGPLWKAPQVKSYREIQRNQKLKPEKPQPR